MINPGPLTELAWNGLEVTSSNFPMVPLEKPWNNFLWRIRTGERRGLSRLARLAFGFVYFFFFFFAGGWGSTENVSPNVKLLKKKNHQMTCLMKGNITVQDALRPQGPKEVGKGTFNSCSKHPRPSGVIFRIITIGAGRATQVEVCSCFGL